MTIRTKQVKLIGSTPLLLHADNVTQADLVSTWRRDERNKNKGPKGDDRSPAWTWITYLYTDGEKLVLPADNLRRALKDAAKDFKLPGNSRKSCKELVASSLTFSTPYLDFTVDGSPVKFDWISELLTVDTEFGQHLHEVKKHSKGNWDLFCNRIPVNGRSGSKHVRVRPRFFKWEVTAELLILSDQVADSFVPNLFAVAGKKGLGDWRPSSPSSGSYGMFVTQLDGKK